MLKALLLKELRESAWIALVLLVADLALVADNAGYNVLPFLELCGDEGRDVPFVDGNFLGFFMVSAALAVALGLGQTVVESRRGTWLFLLHRPLGMRRVIAAKLAVGGGLYLLCGAVAIFSYAAWALMPGKHASPFLWWMTASPWEAWGVIVIVYLAAFLAGMRTARWFGTRLLPLAAGGVLALLADVLPDVLAVAGHRGLCPGGCLPGRTDPLHCPDTRFLMRGATMCKPQRDSPTARPSRGPGHRFGAVFALAAGWGITIWEGLRPNRVVNETLIIRPDGTPVIQCCVLNGYAGVTYRALDGNELPPAKGTNPSLGGILLPMPRLDSLFPLAGDVRAGRYYDGEAPSTNAWYFLHDGTREGRGYFVGYNLQSKLCLGFIGRDGFRPDQPPVEQWFPVDGAKMANYTALLRYRFDDYRYESGILLRGRHDDFRDPAPRGRSAAAIGQDTHGIARPDCLGNLEHVFEGKAAEGDSPWRPSPSLAPFGGADKRSGHHLRANGETMLYVPDSRMASRPQHPACSDLTRRQCCLWPIARFPTAASARTFPGSMRRVRSCGEPRFPGQRRAQRCKRSVDVCARLASPRHACLLRPR